MPANTSVPDAGFRLVTSKTHLVDRPAAVAMAEKHKSLRAAPVERDLDPKHVAELAKRVRAGLAIAFNWATAQFDGNTIRMNGQHSSLAVLECGDDLPARMAIHVDHYEADNTVGLGLLFRQFDSRLSARSRADVAGAYQGLVPELAVLGRKRVKLGVEGIAWYTRAIEKLPTASGDDLYTSLLQPVYHPFLAWLDTVLSIKTPEMEKAPVVAAMYGTFLQSQTGAQDFWSHAAKDDLADDSDPRAVLSRELVRIKEEREPVAPAAYYAKCVKAWNAFREGDRIRSLNVNPAKGLPSIAA